jgi:L-rhamnose mutarotase
MAEREKNESPLKRVCFVLQVKKELLEEYKSRHQKIWPEMLRVLKEAGIHNYSIFLRPDGLMVNYFETADVEQSFRIARSSPVYEKWQEAMARYFVSESGDLSKESGGGPLEQVFYLA